MPYGLLSLAMTGLLVFCLADAITRDDAEVRHLPKPLWVFVILLMPLVGSVLWLVIGRPPPRFAARRGPWARSREDGRPGARPKAPGATRAAAQDLAAQEEEFRRRFRERVEAQRRKGREVLSREEERRKEEQEGP